MRLFFLLLIISYSKSEGQIPKKPELPDNIEIVLNTEGDLKLSGSAVKAVTTNKAQNLVNDNLVKQFSEAKETKVFTTKAEAKKGKQHEPPKSRHRSIFSAANATTSKPS